MYVSGSGNVGIGTTTPSKTLEVAGDISSSGDIYLENNHKLIWIHSTDGGDGGIGGGGVGQGIDGAGGGGGGGCGGHVFIAARKIVNAGAIKAEGGNGGGGGAGGLV